MPSISNPFSSVLAQETLESPVKLQYIDMVVIFGAGNYADLKLHPALATLVAQGKVGAVLVCSRSSKESTASYGIMQRENLRDLGTVDEIIQQYIPKLSYLPLDVASPEGFQLLAEFIGNQTAIFYLSLPCHLFSVAIHNLAKAGLFASRDRKVALEKPLGRNAQEVSALNQLIEQVCETPQQVVRVDHYLGKLPIQQLFLTRAANPLIESILSNKLVARVDFVMLEKVAVNGRHYDGAFLDMSNHAMTALATGLSNLSEDVVQSRIEFTKSLRLLTNTLRCGQYEGFECSLETFASFELRSECDRWRDVPIKVTTGKCLSEKRTELVFTLHRNSLTASANGKLPPVIRFGIYPETSITNLKVEMNSVRELSTICTYANTSSPEAHHRLFSALIDGDDSLFISATESNAQWQVIQPVLGLWASEPPQFFTYERGSDILDIQLL